MSTWTQAPFGWLGGGGISTVGRWPSRIQDRTVFSDRPMRLAASLTGTNPPCPLLEPTRVAVAVTTRSISCSENPAWRIPLTHISSVTMPLPLGPSLGFTTGILFRQNCALPQGLVAHTGFEPVISALRGRCPWPLDECATQGQYSGWGSRIRTSAYRSRVCRPTARRIPNSHRIVASDSR